MRISDWSSDVCSSDLALVDQLVIGLDRILQFNPARAQFFDRFVDVGGGEREMLDALALIVADEFLDLRILVLAFVQGNADRAVGGDHRLAEQPRRLALDVEIFLLLEAEQLGVEARRSEEHTSELQSLMRLSYAVLSLK